MVGEGDTSPSRYPPPPQHTHTHTPRQPRTDRAVSCRKRRRAVPSATHCLPSRGPSVPPPNVVSVSPPTPRSRMRDWNQVPKLSRSDAGKVPESVGALQGEQAPHLAPKGGRRAISRVESPTLLASHLGLPVREGSQPKDIKATPSQGTEPAEGQEAQYPFPVRPLIPPKTPIDSPENWRFT